MNDVSGASIKCPICNGYLQPELIGNEYIFICACGYGKEDYLKKLKQTNPYK